MHALESYHDYPSNASNDFLYTIETAKEVRFFKPSHKPVLITQFSQRQQKTLALLNGVNKLFGRKAVPWNGTGEVEKKATTKRDSVTSAVS